VIYLCRTLGAAQVFTKKSPYCLTHTTSVAPAHRSSSRFDMLPHPFGAVNDSLILNGRLAQKRTKNMKNYTNKNKNPQKIVMAIFQKFDRNFMGGAKQE
jgi:hypothetical protein